MNNQIFKYVLPYPGSTNTVSIPYGSRILTAQMQGPTLCIWALVTSNSPTERKFFVAATGYSMVPDTAEYIATAQDTANGLVWHVFELRS